MQNARMFPQPQRALPSMTMTRWKNPTENTVRFKLAVGDTDRKANAGRPFWHEVVIEPGGEVELPSHFDQAIQRTNADGVVVSGKAPQLMRNGEVTRKIPELDVDGERLRKAEEELLEAARRADGAERELKLAKGQAVVLEEERKRRAAAEQSAAEEQAKREALEKELAELRSQKEAALQGDTNPSGKGSAKK